MKFSPQQELALKAVNNWYQKPWPTDGSHKIFRVFGYAGTGKTTLAIHFAQNIDGDVLFGSFTGKAALVMRKNGCWNAKTLHSLIYKPVVDSTTGEVEFLKNPESALKDADLLVIDECSMVYKELAEDIMSYGVPILVLGDPAQLPPVGDDTGYFTEVDPDVMLTEIHRQARDNPIIDLATSVRMGKRIHYGTYGESEVVEKARKSMALEADTVIVGRNAFRTDLNRKIRRMKGFKGDCPQPGEKLICLKNDADLKIFNGGIFSVENAITDGKKVGKEWIKMVLKDEDDPDRGPVIVRTHKSFFYDDVSIPSWKVLRGTQSFDFGYCLTCHKSQGSQWDNVLIYDESYCFGEDRNRWLYTSITRAAERVIIVR